MSNTIPFPSERLQYDGVKNPLFVSDIANANQQSLLGLKAMTGLTNTDFAIISGLIYSAGVYSEGIIYYNGSFYFALTCTEGKCLTPLKIAGTPKIHSDSVSRDIYSFFYASVSNAGTPESTPTFTGSMDSYRLSLSSIKTNLITNYLTIANATASYYTKSEVDTLLLPGAWLEHPDANLENGWVNLENATAKLRVRKDGNALYVQGQVTCPNPNISGIYVYLPGEYSITRSFRYPIMNLYKDIIAWGFVNESTNALSVSNALAGDTYVINIIIPLD